MADAVLGELRLVSFDPPPDGWARCDGQLLDPAEHPQLFELLGTRYGGDGVTTFGLPDMRGRAAAAPGTGLAAGQQVGEERHTLTTAEMPAHNHGLLASTLTGNMAVPTSRVLSAENNQYRAASDLTTLHPSSITSVGTSQSHENRQPFLVLSWCIALTGVYPTAGG
jgi:microcystin-dependent protein